MQKVTMNSGYIAHDFYNCIDDYKKPKGDWNNCPYCGLRPLVWTFNNGRSTACGCWNSEYEHFSIYAESIGSALKRQKENENLDYNTDELRKNWNHWCKTGKILFEHASKRTDGKWYISRVNMHKVAEIIEIDNGREIF